MDSCYEILKNENVSQNVFKLTLKIDGFSIPRPGQFYQIRCSSGNDPLFRRPFSVHRLLQRGHSTTMEILYRVAGRGTEWLSQKEKGERLDILGPFGNGFLIDQCGDPIVLIARGIGIAPIYAVGEEVRRKDKKRKVFILIGARVGERVFYESECKRLGEVFIYTDDGSKGFKGKASELLGSLVKEKRIPERFYVYACGPAGMLKDLADLSLKFQFEGQAALEERLGCGFGACLSCACPLKPQAIVRTPGVGKTGLAVVRGQNESLFLNLQGRSGLRPERGGLG